MCENLCESVDRLLFSVISVCSVVVFLPVVSVMKPGSGWIQTQRRPVTYEPDVAEWISEPALSMGPPRPLVVLEVVQTARRAGLQSAGDQAVRIVAEYFQPRGCDAELRGTLPAIPGRLGEEEGRSLYLKSANGTKDPQLSGAQCTLIPLDCLWRIFNRQHRGYDWPMDLRCHDHLLHKPVRYPSRGVSELSLRRAFGFSKGPWEEEHGQAEKREHARSGFRHDPNVGARCVR